MKTIKIAVTACLLILAFATESMASDRFSIYIWDGQNNDYGEGYIEYDKSQYASEFESWKLDWEDCFNINCIPDPAKLSDIFYMQIDILDAQLIMDNTVFIHDDFKEFGIMYSASYENQDFDIAYRKVVISNSNISLNWSYASRIYNVSEVFECTTFTDEYSCDYPNGEPCLRWFDIKEVYAEPVEEPIDCPVVEPVVCPIVPTTKHECIAAFSKNKRHSTSYKLNFENFKLGKLK